MYTETAVYVKSEVLTAREQRHVYILDGFLCHHFNAATWIIPCIRCSNHALIFW